MPSFSGPLGVAQFNDRTGVEYEQRVDEFREFLEDNQYFLQLNRETIFELISSHGRIDELLFYAKLVCEHERVIQHHLQRGNHRDALDVLTQLDDDARHDDLFYKYSPILMHFVPVEMVELLMHVEFLDACKLIPALMRYESSQQQQQQQQQQPFSSSLGSVPQPNGQALPVSGNADSQV